MTENGTPEGHLPGSAPDPAAKTNPSINSDSVPTKQTHDDAEQANAVDDLPIATSTTNDSQREVFDEDGEIITLPEGSRGTPEPDH